MIKRCFCIIIRDITDRIKYEISEFDCRRTLKNGSEVIAIQPEETVLSSVYCLAS